MHKLLVSEIVTTTPNMAGRKKGVGGKCRGERVQVHATFTFQQADSSPREPPAPGASPPDPEDVGKVDKELKGSSKGVSAKGGLKSGVVLSAGGAGGGGEQRLSFADHAITLLDQMMRERSVGELLKLGPREEMLGLTPLSMAAAVGHVEGTRKLLEAGAAVDDKSSDGSTALQNAAQWRHFPVLDLLLQHGANVAATNNDDNNALMIALRHGDVRAVNSLWPHRKSLDINHTNNDGNTAIHLVAERKWESCVQFLIQNGADVNKQNNSGRTALHIAASKGDQTTAERLLAAGANLLLEDHNGKNPFCLAVMGFHDVLAGYFLRQLKVDDKLYFCKRQVHKLQSQLNTETFFAWNALSFLTSDGSLRDALYQCDVMRVAVQALGRRGLHNEVAVQSCVVCSDLMYNPFPAPDLRFIKQFLLVHGPEAVLDRLDCRGGQEHAHGGSSGECKELNQLQGQLQSRQQQADFNTVFILLPIMAMAETPLGREWFTEAINQQRIAAHLRRVASYRELLQLVGVVQQEMCGRAGKVDRVALMERFVAFFHTLENRDREEKVRQLLEQEEREKSRKEKKREKKRQQRLKQKLKTKASEPAVEDTVVKEKAAGSEVCKTKSQPLDALDDIPLTVGPDGVQDFPNPASATLPPGLAQDGQGSDDEWVMVGGKRCYPPKTKAGFAPCREDTLRDQDQIQTCEMVKTFRNADSLPNNFTEDTPTNTAPFQGDMPAVSMNEVECADLSGTSRQPAAFDMGGRSNRSGKRWADVARSGNAFMPFNESPLVSMNQSSDYELDTPREEKPLVQKTPAKKEVYNEQFPSLSQQLSAASSCEQHSSANTAQQRQYSVEVLGAAQQLLEKLCSSGRSFIDRLPISDSACGPGSLFKPAPNVKVEPSVLYEALTGWMWQAAVSGGLITPDVHSPQVGNPGNLLAPFASQFLKPQSATANHNFNEDPTAVPESVTKPPYEEKLNNHTPTAPRVTARSEVSTNSLCSPTPVSFKDWFEMTSADDIHAPVSKHQSVSAVHSDNGSELSKLHSNQAGGGESAAVSSRSVHTVVNPLKENSPGFPKGENTDQEPSSASVQEKDTFLWSDFSHWVPSQPLSVGLAGAAPPHVSGQPGPDSSKLLGVPFTPTLDSTSSLEFPLQGNRQQQMVQTACSLPSDTANSRFLTSMDRYQEHHKGCKPSEPEADVFSQMPSTSPTEGNSNYSWLFQDPAKARIKTAVVSVPRSSDSDSTQSSSPENKNDPAPEDTFSIKSDTSRSSILNNDSFHYLCPGDSRTSTIAGLHECLAPGFIRAAVGDSHQHSFGFNEGTACSQEVKSYDLGPLLGNPGSLSCPLGPFDTGTRRTLDNPYPDLSVVPEREQALAFPTHLPKAMRVVGQGRPAKSKSQQLETPSSNPITNDLDIQSILKAAAGLQLSTPSTTTATTAPTEPTLSIFLTPPPSPDPTTASTTTKLAAAQQDSTPERPDSPDVLFPETLRDDDKEDQPPPVDVFPSIHDMKDGDLFQDVFSNSYFLEQIAIDQIRRRLRAMGGGGEEALKSTSVLSHDLDYYASLYGVRLRDILGPPVEDKPGRAERGAAGARQDPGAGDQSVPGWKVVVKELGRRMTSREDLKDSTDMDLAMVFEDTALADWPWSDKVTAPQIVSGGGMEGDEGWWQEGSGSRRWRKWLRQILDLPWTMRRQFGKIVLPARSIEFNIGRTGHHPLILGFLTDGTEVGVLGLDRTRHALDTRLMATVAADSEPDVHFILRYKAVWECGGRVYLAMELCDYTLDEYVGIVRLDHRQDPLSANRLAWQLLKGLKYLHCNFAVPHGNLMPGWIFVDCDGRLRLAGYGLRDVTSSARAGSKDFGGGRNTIEGDSRYWRATEHVPGTLCQSSFQADIQVAGMLVHYILTGGRHPYGNTGPEVEANLTRNVIRQQPVSQEADHLVFLMTQGDPLARPCIDACLKHPFFWSGEKRFRLVLIVGSDILTEMKTGVPLTGAGSSSMVDILNVYHISTVSENWLGEVDSVLAKEMRAFRQYKNNLPELVLFVYNCCLHYDKMSVAAKEVLDDPCKYFQSRFSGLFMAVYRAMRASDRTDRTCYKPFF